MKFFTALHQRFCLPARQLRRNIKTRAHFLTGKLLDFGCGAKPYKEFFTNAAEYVGLDYENPGHLHKNESIDVFYNGKEIPFPSGHFDSILATQVLEHVEDLPFTLKEWHRVLKQGGRLLITAPFTWEEHELPHDYRRFTAIGLEQLLVKNGFHCVEIKKLGTPIEVISQMEINYISSGVKSRFMRIVLEVFFIIPYSAYVIVLSRLLPKSEKLYFDTLVLAEKL